MTTKQKWSAAGLVQVLVIALSGYLGYSGAPVAEISSEMISDVSRVREVIDGDTIVVDYHGPAVDREIVRLLCIDTPERGEYGCVEASTCLSAMVGGGNVRLDWGEKETATRGKYGRLLAYLFVEDVNVNLELVRAGWTSYDTRYGRSLWDAEFRVAEREAKEARRGLWTLAEE